MFIAPIGVLAAITYVNSVSWVNQNFNMIWKDGPQAGLLNGPGLVVAIILMVLFTAMNLGGAKFLSDNAKGVPVVSILLAAAVGTIALGPFKSWLFGGDGIFLATLTGPGRIWLQTLTLSNFAHALAPYLPGPGREVAEVGAGAVIGSVIRGLTKR